MRKAEEHKREGLFRTSISCLFGATRNFVLGLVAREPAKRYTQPSIADCVNSSEEHFSVLIADLCLIVVLWYNSNHTQIVLVVCFGSLKWLASANFMEKFSLYTHFTGLCEGLIEQPLVCGDMLVYSGAPHF